MSHSFFSVQAAVASKPHGLARRLALLLIHLYQQFISPLLPLGCRYYPTCSHYTAEAITQHGTGRGVWLGVRRILRCHPFAPGGFDPVPAATEIHKELAR